MRATLLKGRTLRTPERALQAFSVYRSAASGSLGTPAGTRVAFDAREFDTASVFDIATNHRAIPTIAGLYRLSATIAISTTLTSGQFVAAELVKNGTAIKNGTAAEPANNIATVDALVQANGTTDYFEIWVTWGGPATIALIVGSANTWFHGRLIGKS